MWLIVVKELYDREYVKTQTFLTNTPEAWKSRYSSKRNTKIDIVELKVMDLK